MKLTIFAAAVLLLMTSVVVMIQARSVTRQVGGVQRYIKVGLCHFRLTEMYAWAPAENFSKEGWAANQ